ncbi:IclR family transcriptional regulator [Maritalea mediterranea]|uniref:IclR family transcriptional regulator n=1 Tax=Maritalea mediterranea TaxID=2909667 RepID=A0ABS9E5Q9_9HYPH|nr:IclR family transcriptional regulator C-terminal domain-containing protein [Maritalea mediterranea]MCF4098113.1 IclR family transcriptional regulator [Maritalea mediterranea]
MIGTRLKRITHNEHSDSALLELIAPSLKLAAAQFGVAFFLSRLRGKAVEIIHVETPGDGVSYLHPGLGRRPVHACSCSKAVAAFSPEVLFSNDLHGQLRAYTEFTVTNIDDLKAEFEIIRQRGFAECVEEIERGMCSVAAPLAPSGPGATMSIGAVGSVRIFSPTFREKIGPQIVKLARELSTTLGWDVAQDEKIVGAH